MRHVRRLSAALVSVLVLAASAAAQTPAATSPPPERMHAGLVAARGASAAPLQVHLDRGFPQTVVGRFAISGATPGARAQAFVTKFAGLYGQQFDPQLRTSVRRALPQGAVLGQTYRGVPVYGARLSVLSAGNQVFGSVGRLATALAVDVAPALTAAAAEASLRKALGRGSATRLGEPRLVVYVPELINAPAGPARPAYQITLAGAPGISALVDGNSGQILMQEPLEKEAYEMVLFDANQTADGSTCFADSSETDLAATNTGIKPAYLSDTEVGIAKTSLDNAYNVFRNLLGRDSFDGLGARLVGSVHANVPNARWHPVCLDMAARDTVVTNDVWLHEMAHGVTQFTSGLVYRDQSGALDESFADTMAAASDDNWLIDGGSSFGIFRDMEKPADKGHPGHMSGFLKQQADYGGVHSNSGIPNKARQLMADGGTNQYQPGTKNPVLGFGRAKMAKIAYIGNLLLGENASFEDAAGMEIVAGLMYAVATPSYGIGRAEVCTARNAWAAVGVLQAAADSDCDGTGDGSDADRDGDGVSNAADNCPDTNSKNFNDLDGDRQGDVCDADADGDGVENASDNCAKANPDQADKNANGKGDVCEDLDADGVLDQTDNCVNVFNPAQTDTNDDTEGDACEADNDGDGVIDDLDKCQFVSGGKEDSDGDGLGNACDPCPSGADEVVSYTSGNKALGTKPKPVLKDSDADGTPDGCEKLRSLAVFRPSGSRLQRPGAIRPNATTPLVVVGKTGSTFRVPIAPCLGKPCATLYAKGGLIQVAIGGLQRGVGVRIVDDLGMSAAVVRPGNRGALVLRFRPESSRRYTLEGLIGRALPKRGDRFAVKVLGGS